MGICDVRLCQSKYYFRVSYLLVPYILIQSTNPSFFSSTAAVRREDLLKRLNYSVFLSKQNKQHIRTIGHLPTYLSVWEGNINNSAFGKDFTAVDTAMYPRSSMHAF